jgi:hypothetical protein
LSRLANYSATMWQRGTYAICGKGDAAAARALEFGNSKDSKHE